jgi:hypothetical protein
MGEREMSEISEGQGAAHCWHEQSQWQIAASTDPASRVMVCCFCGGNRIERKRKTIPDGHGEHFVSNSWGGLFVWDVVKDAEHPCIQRPTPVVDSLESL